MSHQCGYPAAGDVSHSITMRPCLAAGEAAFCIGVRNVAGDEFQVEVNGSMRGWDLMRMIGQLEPSDTPGLYTPVVGGSLIDPNKTLQELGLAGGDDATLIFEAATAQDLEEISKKYADGRAETMTDRELAMFFSLRDFTVESDYIILAWRLRPERADGRTAP
eukprot:TRINITY_DN24461_c0_g1_i4.p1 TRINITY_DN24461_c0_g1~~TRINITY_DN24461_c0_g1_i4.p1  ORF type:complete len:163 (+),score=15.45 TRINITY_DN24461_c0_g1_i4:65-553(+)